MASLVYFIQVGKSGPIKVGFTQCLADRLRQLQCAAAEQINVLLTVPGGTEVESAIHAALADHRLMGEWFRDAPNIREMIRNLSNTGPAAYFGFSEICPTDAETAEERSIGDRVAMFLRMHYERNAAREIAQDFDVKEITARNWLAGNTPISKHMTRMVARWGGQFLTFVYEPVYANASPLDRIERAIAELTVLRSEMKVQNHARLAEETRDGPDWPSSSEGGPS